MTPQINIDISIKYKPWKPHVKQVEQRIHEIAREVFQATSLANYVKSIEFSLLFVDNKKISKINNEFRGENKPTNVLSFPMHVIDCSNFASLETIEGFIMLGDVIFSYEIIEKEANEQNKSFENHFFHLLTHGILHLIGYDHQNDEEADLMEKFEVQILQKFGINSPYL